MKVEDMADARVTVEALRMFLVEIRDDDDAGDEGMTTREIVASLRLVAALEVLMSER